MAGGMPKPTEAAKEAFQRLVPKHPTVGVRPMFGNLAGFANGNMFTGLFGSDLFVRVTESDRARLLKEGGSDFAPMAGRPMKGYVLLPAGWADKPEGARVWIERALEHTLTIPPKAAKPKAAKKKG